MSCCEFSCLRYSDLKVNKAIISFLASFVLVRYKLTEAKREELKAEIVAGHRTATSPTSLKYQDTEKGQNGTTGYTPSASGIQQLIPEPPIYSCNPRLEQVGPFSRQPPTELLERCHALCITLASVGFVLALMGIVCYAWALQPVSVAAFSTAMLGICLLAGAGTVMVWDTAAITKYYTTPYIIPYMYILFQLNLISQV